MKFYLKGITIHFITCFVVSLSLSAQLGSQFPGCPIIHNYPPEEYQSTYQVWSAIQDSRGIMYFGDQVGILEFDGLNWRKVSIPNKSVVRSMATDKDGKIYVGANNEIGYLEVDSIGNTKYKSLIKYIPDSTKSFQSIWKVIPANDKIYFVGKYHILIWDTQKIDVIKVTLQAKYAFLVDDKVYVKDINKGLCYIDNNKLIPLVGCEKFNQKKRAFFFINSLNNNKLLIYHTPDYFYEYNTLLQKLSTFKVEKFVSQYLEANHGFNAINISNDLIAIATVRGGIIIINKKGRLVQIINKKRGLISDCVYTIYEDKEKNLWITTKEGLSKIEYNYPFVEYLPQQGINDDIFCTFKHNNIQYIGTNYGLDYYDRYIPQTYQDNHYIKSIDGLVDCNELLLIKDHLIACHFYGISEIFETKAETIVRTNRVFCGLYDEFHYPNYFFWGENHAINIGEIEINSGKKIEIKNQIRIEKDISQIRSLAIDKQGNLWAASYNEGVYYIRFNDQNLNDYEIFHLGEKNGLPREIYNCKVKSIDGNINVLTNKGIYKLNDAKNLTSNSQIEFIHDNFWGKYYTSDSLAVKDILPLNKNQYFIYGKVSGILTNNNETSSFIYKPYQRLTKEANCISIEDGRYLKLGKVKSFSIYDLYQNNNSAGPHHTLIRKVVTINDSVIFKGNYPKDSPEIFGLKQPDYFIPQLDHTNDALKFYFISSFQEAPEQTSYQYKIEELSEEWSQWSKVNFASFINIPKGKYTFKVRSQNAYGTIGSVAEFRFVIKPGWYETSLAYLIYLLLSIWTIWLVIKLYTRNLTKQKIKLNKLVKLRTSELHDAIHILENQKVELKNKQSEILNKNEVLDKHRKQLQNTIDKLKEAQSSLVQQEKMASLGILTAGVAHEINNPLNYILGGYTGLESYIKELGIENEDVEVLLDSIKTGVDRAADIVSGLNQFSRTKETFDEECDIHAILDNSILMIKHLAKNRIEIIKNYSASCCKIKGNVGKMHQVFINIITNSCQAIDNTGAITITTTSNENNLIVRIEDTGSGIEKGHLNKITDPFFTTKEPGKGSGLGLSITYKIIQEHFGKIEFESEPNKGTVATITLPV